MLRFLPDGWLEGLLRPFILMDPSAGVYFEIAAPDLRFAVCLVFLAVALLARRVGQVITFEQGRLSAALFLLFYIWTFAIGNGRYFIAGLLLIGPVLVLSVRLLPGTTAFHNTLLGLVIGLQLLAISQTFMPNAWGVVPWRETQSLTIEPSPLRERPAVFLTISTQTYAALVTRFHPQSRWANLTGQVDIRPGLKEYARLQPLLASALPKYLVFPFNPEWGKPNLQPIDEVHAQFVTALAARGMALTGDDCSMLRSPLAPRVPNQPRTGVPVQGFWFCPVRQSSEASATQEVLAQASHRMADVFDRVEQRCPRFFPPNNGVESQQSGVFMRYYVGSDVRLYIDANRMVGFKYFRAVNPTIIGTIEQVRRGDFAIACDKVPGRYRLPWNND